MTVGANEMRDTGDALRNPPGYRKERAALWRAILLSGKLFLLLLRPAVARFGGAGFLGFFAKNVQFGPITEGLLFLGLGSLTRRFDRCGRLEAGGCRRRGLLPAADVIMQNKPNFGVWGPRTGVSRKNEPKQTQFPGPSGASALEDLGRVGDGGAVVNHSAQRLDHLVGVVVLDLRAAGRLELSQERLNEMTYKDCGK